MTAPLEGLADRAVTGDDWAGANQTWLASAVAKVTRQLRQHAGLEDAGQAGAGEPASPDHANLPPPALETLCAAFRLSRFEREILLCCAAMELDARFAGVCAAAQGTGAAEPSRPYPTFGLALAALSEPHWSALGPDAPLRRWRLIELPTGAPLTLAPLRIDECVLHFLAGVRQRDERLACLLTPVAPPATLTPSQHGLARRIAAVWRETEAGAPLPVVQLIGGGAAERTQVAAAACQVIGLRLAVLHADAAPVAHAEIEALARLAEREIALAGTALLIDCDPDTGSEGGNRNALRLAGRLAGPVLVAARDPQPLAGRPSVSWEVPEASPDERRAAWQEGLGADMHGPALEALVWSFGLGVAAIADCAAEVRARAAGTALAPDAAGPLAWSVCRNRSRARLEGLATRVEPAAGWQDLVLPAPQATLLRQVLVQVRNRATVYGTWGFAGRMATSLGITALFHGPSGTGKSLAAEVLAGELALDLFRIDLSAVVSKYIGETEKNLRRVFDAAETSGAVLVFDEADALFGKRSEVKDSHDRFANIQVSYLLQRMETYRGLAVLTTNLKSSMDTAFLRRLRFIVHFPFPDAAQRAEIWQRAFPPGMPTNRLDVGRLARLEVAGGNIRNIALGGAFLAAEAGEALHMRHLAQAARAEFAKLERPLPEAEVAAWD